MADAAPNYDDLYQAAGTATGLDPDLLRAKDYVESRHDRFAVSPAGAEGVAQLMPRTARELGVTDTFDPQQSIPGGAEYLRRQVATFGDPYTALAAYNAGPHGDFSNPQTRDYVERVANKWDEYRQAKWKAQSPASQKPMSFDDLVPAKPMSFDDLVPKTQGQLPLAQRDEPSPPASPQQTFARNKPYMAASATDFTTHLPPDQEASFRKWVTDNKVPFDPNDATADYDMRGYWQASNNPRAWENLRATNKIPAIAPGGTKVDPNDGQPHFPDWWKTPYHKTFSNESQFADRTTAPHWTPDDKLVTPDGKVVFDDKAQASPPEAEDTGLLGALGAGLKTNVSGAGQTLGLVAGDTTKPAPAKLIKAAEPFELSDLKPQNWHLAGEKVLYGLGASAGPMAGFSAGTAMGGPLAGALGAAIGETVIKLGPIFQEELDKTPNDPNGAFYRSAKKTAVDAVDTGVSFWAFGGVNPFTTGVRDYLFKKVGVEAATAAAPALVAPLKRPVLAGVGNLASQALVTQPAISAAGMAGNNLLDDKPASEGLAANYVPSVLGTVVPAAAIHGAGALLPGRPRPVPAADPQATPQPTPAAGPGIVDPHLPDNYFPGQTGPEPAPVVSPGPAPGPAPTPTPAPPSTEAQAQHTLSIIAAGGDPRQEQKPATPAPTPAPAPAPTPEPTPPAPPSPVAIPPEPTPTPAPPSVESLPRAPEQIQREEPGHAPPDKGPVPAPTPAPPIDSNPSSFTSGSYVMLDPAQLNVDPARFQFKASDPEKGVTGVLRGSDHWEPTLADPITAWQDNAGKVWVANGHQRTDLANRAVAAGQQDVQVPAKIYREADGYTPGYMRALGAFQNIAQGSGTAIDAAKILREVAKAPGEYQLPTLPPKSALTIQAKGLAKLSDEAFGTVVNEIVPSAYAAHVGDLISDPDQQMAALRVLHRAEPRNAEQARMMVTDIRNEGFRKQQESGQGVIELGGGGNDIESIVPERARVLDAALQLLRRNKSVYRAAVEGEDTLTAAGNQLDREGNVQARTQNEQLIDHIGRDAQTRGPLSDALSAAARDVADGKPVSAAVSRFLGQARSDFASGSKGGVERSADHSGTEPPPASGDAGRIDDPGQNGLLAPKGRINVRGQSDMFGADQKPRTEAAPPKPGGAQLDMFGRGDAAIQAQAKRDQEGRGALLAKVDQKPADQGLFADRMEGQGSLLTKPVQPRVSELGTFPVTDRKTRRLIAGRDLTAQVTVRPGETGQAAAGRFVIDRGRTTGHEYLTAVDNATGRVIHAGTNDVSASVGFQLHGRDLPTDSLTVHHNHPGGMGFSPQDLMLMYHPGISHMIAHSDGDVFAAAPGPRNRGERTIDNEGARFSSKIAVLHAIAEKQARKLFDEFWPHLQRSPTPEDVRQVQKSFFDVIARIMHATGHVDYISTRALHPAAERLLVDRLTNAGYNPTEIAGAIRVYSHDEVAAALPQPAPAGAREHGQAADELHRSAGTLRPGSGAAGVPGGVGGRGARAGRIGDERGAAGAPAAGDEKLRRALPVGEGARSGTQTPVTPPPQGLIDRVLSRARDLFENGRTALNEALTQHFTPLAGGSKRAMDIALKLANALRGVNYEFKLLDDHIKKQFPNPPDRLAMGKAMDQQSVLEQKIAEMRANNAQGQLGHTAMTAAQVAHAEATMRAQWTARGQGVDVLPPDQRALVERLARLGDQVWQRMRGRGMVDAHAEGLPYYFARYILQRDALGNIIKPSRGGTGRDIHDFGGNLTSSGPLTRKHLTPEETLAAAQAALSDPGAFLLQDIRAVGSALNRNERAIAGKDFIDGIKRIGVANGGPLMVSHGGPPIGAHPGDYFTIDGHPSFRQWTGSGYKPLYVSKEFEGPVKAVLTQPGSKLYQYAMKAKGGAMTAIMWSPLMHLNVELGRALPVMRGRLFSTKFWTDGKRNSLDPGYMRQAIHDGLAPIGQSWREDAASIAEQADVNRPPAGLIGRASQWKHALDQKVLWNTVFKLQVGIYDSLRTEFQNRGHDARTAGIMAAHEANRFAGALPAENLSRWANMTSNLLLFSRSFTLGNLGVMKDALIGLPRPVLAAIEQHAGPQAAKDASAVIRRKAMGAVVLDIGLAYLANVVFQEMVALGSRAPAMGLGSAAQSVLDDWKTQAAAALKDTGETWNPMNLTRLLPSGNNEPGKTNRAYMGKDNQGRGVYLRTSVGKVGEEFLGWGFTPFQLVENKLSPWFRPLLEDLFGSDTLGRAIYKPNPASFGDFLSNAGRAVTHVMGSLGPVDQVKGMYQLGLQVAGHGDKRADPLTAAARTILPATGLGQISSGFPGGPEAGAAFALKKTLNWQQQQAMEPARDLYANGHQDQAAQLLLDAGVERGKVGKLLQYMNESASQAAAAQFGAKHPIPGIKTMTTGQPLSP